MSSIKIDSLGSLSITDFLLHSAWIATNDVLKLGVMQSAHGQMESIIVRSIKKLINNAEEKFLV